MANSSEHKSDDAHATTANRLTILHFRIDQAYLILGRWDIGRLGTLLSQFELIDFSIVEFALGLLLLDDLNLLQVETDVFIDFTSRC